MNESQLQTNSSKSRQLYWILQVAGWGSFTLVRIVGAITIIQLPWRDVTVELVLLGYAGLGLSHLLREFVRRHRWSDLSIGQLTMRVVVAGFIVGTPLGILTELSAAAALQDPGPLLHALVPGLTTSVSSLIRFTLQIVNSAAVYIAWLTMYFIAVGLRDYRSARLKQADLARELHLAELRLLKSQLNPHFLFNALNSVRALIADSPSRAQDAVTRLANTLRYGLASRQGELVTLAQELAIVADYLDLESLRLAERLRIRIDVTADAQAAQIPVMLLQTLVENAIKHGIAELPAGGRLDIVGGLTHGALILEVANPRPLVSTPPGGEGVGLRNARDRLRLLFGTRASLELDLSAPGMATARLRIPAQR